MSKSIFLGNGIKPRAVRVIYRELMKRKEVTYSKVLALLEEEFEKEREGGNGESKNYFTADFKQRTLSSTTEYKEVKKAFEQLINLLNRVQPGCISEKGRKGKTYTYTGNEENPLHKELNASVQKSISDYVSFLKASAGFFPANWLASFFENTQVLLDVNYKMQTPTYIRSENEITLTNIHLLPQLYEAVIEKKVLRFTYHPFTEQPYELLFHPQFIKEYNGRWFVFGKADRPPYEAFNVAIDRIASELAIVRETEYMTPAESFYKEYFANIVGVTHEAGERIETIVIRTKSRYMHGLILTKPLHKTQHESKPFDNYTDGSYGEITLRLKPNRELQGRILTYGRNLEVIAPASLRNKIKEEAEAVLQHYK
ncbi:MAG: WYL domain-containing protein [Bacteroidaceae bacterium]|nr:WYL domain-containing protein [Bacteroidaceae bacterium]